MAGCKGWGVGVRCGAVSELLTTRGEGQQRQAKINYRARQCSKQRCQRLYISSGRGVGTFSFGHSFFFFFFFSFSKPCEKLLSAPDLWWSGIQTLRKEPAPGVCAPGRELGQCSPEQAPWTSTFLLCFPHRQPQALKANKNGLRTQFCRRTKPTFGSFYFQSAFWGCKWH